MECGIIVFPVKSERLHVCVFGYFYPPPWLRHWLCVISHVCLFVFPVALYSIIYYYNHNIILTATDMHNYRSNHEDG